MERRRLELYAERGETSRFIDLVVDDEGRTIMTTQDVGEAPRAIWGDDDYEFWVTVAAAHKDELVRALIRERDADAPLPAASDGDDLLLALLAERYRGEPGAVDAFREFLAEQGVPHEFASWV